LDFAESNEIGLQEASTVKELYILSGLEAGQVFELKKDMTYIGRSPENDIRITDRTVSRRHLKITRRRDRYFITDLVSRNRTFFDGKYLEPGIEVEARGGIPIAIGMTVICIGEGSNEETMLSLALIEPRHLKDTSESEGIYGRRRSKNNQRELEIFFKISDVLKAQLPVKETLQKILDHILELLKRVERGGFILLDPKNGEIGEIIFRSRKPSDETGVIPYRDVLNRVIQERRPLVVSDVQTEESDEIAETLEISKIRSMMCSPLIKESKVIGAIYVDSRETPNAFRRGDRSLFVDLCQRISVAIDRALLVSHFDTLSLTQKELGL